MSGKIDKTTNMQYKQSVGRVNAPCRRFAFSYNCHEPNQKLDKSGKYPRKLRK
jgi:hypothetical protein